MLEKLRSYFRRQQLPRSARPFRGIAAWIWRRLSTHRAARPLAWPQLYLRRDEAPTAPRPCAKGCILLGSVWGCFSPGVTCGRVVAAAVLVTSFAHGGCVSRSLLSKGLPRRSQPDAQHLPQQRDDRTEREEGEAFIFSRYRCKWVWEFFVLEF